jgi:hypothetical protein
MPIVVSCECGKQLRVPDAHAGKRIKCPGCGDAIRVPDADEEAPTPRRAAAAARADMIRFKCPDCGKQMQAKAEYAGASTECPACQAEVDIPDADAGELERAGIRADKPAAKKAGAGRARDLDVEDEDDRPRGRRRDRDEEDEDEDEEERPRARKGKGKKKQGSKTMLLLGGLAGLLLLCGVGGFLLADFLWLNWIFGGGGADMALVPGDAPAFVSIQVADMWKDPAVKRQVRSSTDSDDPIKELEDNTGLKPEDIERVTIVSPNDDKLDGWSIILTNKNYDKKKILDSLRGNQEITYEGKTYHVGRFGKEQPKAKDPFPMDKKWAPPGGWPKLPEPEKDAIHFVSGRLFVEGKEKGMKRFLEFLKGKRPKGPLDDAIRLVGRRGNHIVVGINPAAMKSKLKGPAKGMFKGADTVLEAQLITVVAKAGESWQLEGTARYSNDSQAQSGKKGFDDGIKSLKDLAKLFDEGGQFKSALDALTVEQKGSNVVLKATIPGSSIEKVFTKKKPPAVLPPPKFPKGGRR